MNILQQMLHETRSSATLQTALLQQARGLVGRDFGDTENGQDMVEYALLAGLLSVVAVAMVLLVGPALDSLFRHIVNGLNSA